MLQQILLGGALVGSFEGANGLIIFGWTTALVIAVIQRFYPWHR